MRRLGAGAACLWIAMVSGLPGIFAEEASTQTISQRAADALRLVESGDDYQQQLGFLRLEALRDPAVLPALMPYTSSKNPDLRAQSLRAVAAIQGVGAVPLLLGRLAHDRDTHVRRAAILGVEPYVTAHPDALFALIAALKDKDTTVRMAAVDVVSRVNDPAAREAIITRYKREGRKDVRRVLEMAMKRMAAR